MNKKFFISAAAAVMAGLFAGGASAATVLINETFAGDIAGINWAGDSLFTSVPGPGNVKGQPSVDLLGPGYYGSLAKPFKYAVDLDGTTGLGNIPAGEIQSVKTLGLGNYTITFDLSGNLRNAVPQTFQVAIGSQTKDFTVGNTAAFALETVSFYGASGKVSFIDEGPSTQKGNLLANITVSDVPEPASWALMFFGVGAVGAMLRSRRRAVLAA